MTGELYPAALTADTIRDALTRLNLDAAAAHHPGPDGRCPLCGTVLCRPWTSAVRALRDAGVTVSIVPAHEPTRPGWHCETCDEPWPCCQARGVLGDAYADRPGRPGLVTHMGRMLVDAAREVGTPADELMARFLGWVSW